MDFREVVNFIDRLDETEPFFVYIYDAISLKVQQLRIKKKENEKREKRIQKEEDKLLIIKKKEELNILIRQRKEELKLFLSID
jgi:hypothetical protein